MAESKFEETPRFHDRESKFADDFDESKKGESKFADAEDPEVNEFALTTTATIFGSDEIIEKLVQFWGEKLAKDINTFFADNCYQFDVDDSEHKLVYTKLHKKYEKIVESHLQTFREEENITEAEMYNRIRKCTSENELAQMIVDLVLCCADFPCFVELMKSKQMQLEEERGSFYCEEEKC